MVTETSRESMASQVRARRVVVLGLARSGSAAAELLRGHDALVVGVDEGPGAPELLASAWARRTLHQGFETARTEALDDAVCLVLSPGVPMTHGLVQEAQRRGIPVLSEIELAYRFTASPVIAITGSKGKSTTTALVGEMLQGGGVRAAVAGNIGLPFSRVVATLAAEAWAVLEISSFQLESVDTLHARVAVLLHISPDHLDRYDSMEDYAAAKARILRNQTPEDLFVVDPADPYGADLAASARARVIGFGHAWRGTGVVRDGAAILWIENGTREPLVAVEEIPLLGEHNVSNAMAALAVVRGLGLWNAGARQGLRTFRGLEFRMQPCGEIGGIHFVNDAKSTTVESVRAAVRGLPGPVLLAMGGRNKGLDFSALRGDVRRLRSLLVFGEAAREITSQLAGAVPVVAVNDLDDLVRRALELGHPGDTLLFSPGCTSFDMFRNAEERGHAFTAAVQRAKEARGA